MLSPVEVQVTHGSQASAWRAGIGAGVKLAPGAHTDHTETGGRVHEFSPFCWVSLRYEMTNVLKEPFHPTYSSFQALGGMRSCKGGLFV